MARRSHRHAVCNLLRGMKAVKAPKILGALILTLFSVIASAEKPKQSISDLPTLSKLLIHHFDCTVGLVVAAGFNEATFVIDTVASQSPRGTATAKVDKDELIASASASMLNLDWKQNGKLIATSQMMIKNSPTEAFVLLLGDPADATAQGSVNCVAATYAEKKGGRQ